MTVADIISIMEAYRATSYERETMSNFEKIQSDELAECQDYQDWLDYQQDEAMQAMDSDLDYQLDSLNAELDELCAECDELNAELDDLIDFLGV